MTDRLSIDPARRTWSLILGVLYLACGVLAGLNVGAVWDIMALDDAHARARQTLSTLTIVFPHVMATTGFILLIAGNRFPKRSFIAVALLPAVYAIVCLIVRAEY